MDIFNIIIIIFGGIGVVIGCIVGSFCATLVVEGWGYAQLRYKIESLENKIKSAQGVEVRTEKAQRLQGAVIEAAAIMKDENIPKEEKTKALMALAAKYPDVALDLVRKVGINGLL